MQSDWSETFFRGVALDAWRYIVNPEMTRAEVDFIERALNTGPSARLLDVPCGNGRHAIELARRGYQLTGLDRSQEFIEEARTAFPQGIRWVKADMRALHWESEFEGGYCFGNSFGYLSWDEARGFLNAIARALIPGARFIVDTGMAAESILPSLSRNRWHLLGNILMLSESTYHCAESRMDIDYTFVRNGEVEKRPTSSYVFSAGELCRMHGEAGLEVLDLLASTTGDPYHIGSPRLLLISSKR